MARPFLCASFRHEEHMHRIGMRGGHTRNTQPFLLNTLIIIEYNTLLCSLIKTFPVNPPPANI